MTSIAVYMHNIFFQDEGLFFSSLSLTLRNVPVDMITAENPKARNEFPRNFMLRACIHLLSRKVV